MFKFLRYILGGLVNTLITYITIIILLKIFKFKLIFSNFMGFSTGIITSFFINRNFVFKSSNFFLRNQIIRFLSAFIFSYFINVLLLYIFLWILPDQLFFPQAIAMIGYSLSFFSICRIYVFK